CANHLEKATRGDDRDAVRWMEMACVARDEGFGAAGEGYFQEGCVVGVRKAEVCGERVDLLAARDEAGHQLFDHWRSDDGPELRPAQDGSVFGKHACVVERNVAPIATAARNARSEVPPGVSSTETKTLVSKTSLTRGGGARRAWRGLRRRFPCARRGGACGLLRAGLHQRPRVAVGRPLIRRPLPARALLRRASPRERGRLAAPGR